MLSNIDISCVIIHKQRYVQLQKKNVIIHKQRYIQLHNSSRIYVGSSTQSLSQRLTEHKYDSKIK